MKEVSPNTVSRGVSLRSSFTLSISIGDCREVEVPAHAELISSQNPGPVSPEYENVAVPCAERVACAGKVKLKHNMYPTMPATQI